MFIPLISHNYFKYFILECRLNYNNGRIIYASFDSFVMIFFKFGLSFID